MRRIVLLSCLLALSACAPALDTALMRPSAEIIQQIPINPALERNIAIGEVIVPTEYNQSSVGSLDSAGLRTALADSLLLANYLPRAEDEPEYTLSARLLKLDLPDFGFDLDARCDITYKLVRNSDDDVILQETIKQGYLATFGESFAAYERGRLASSKAIRENMTQMIRVLGNTDLPKPAKPTKGAKK